MAISPQLRQFKSSGVYRLEFDKSQTSNINVGTLRLMVGHSKKGPFNTPVLIENQEDFKNVYGSPDKALETLGMFFHRSCLAALTRGPILALNMQTFTSSDTGNWVSMFTEGSVVTSAVNLTTSGTAPYTSFHDMDKFMKPTDTALLSVATQTNNQVISFTNLKNTDLTIVARTAKEVDGFEVIAEEWYGAGNVPGHLHAKDYLSDFMIDVFVFKGTFTPSLLDTDPVFGNYFTSTGLIKSKLDEFSNLRNVTLLAKYTGSLLPGFKDMEGASHYIESMINAEARRTGLFCAVDEDRVLADIVGNKNNVNQVGHGLGTNIQTSFLSYDDVLRQSSFTGDVDEQTQISFTNDANNIPTTTIKYDTSTIATSIAIAKGDYLPANTTTYPGRLARVLQVGTDTSVSNYTTLTIKTDIPVDQTPFLLIDDEDFIAGTASLLSVSVASTGTVLYVANASSWLTASTTPAVDHNVTYDDAGGALNGSFHPASIVSHTAQTTPTTLFTVDEDSNAAVADASTFTQAPVASATTVIVADASDWITAGTLTYTNTAGTPVSVTTGASTGLPVNFTVANAAAYQANVAATIDSGSAAYVANATTITLSATHANLPFAGTLTFPTGTITYTSRVGAALSGCTSTGFSSNLPAGTDITSTVGKGWEVTVPAFAANPPASGAAVTGQVYGFALGATTLTVAGSIANIRPAGVLTFAGGQTITYKSYSGQIFQTEGSTGITVGQPLIHGQAVATANGFWEITSSAQIGSAVTKGEDINGIIENVHVVESINYYKPFESAATEYTPISIAGYTNPVATTIPTSLAMLSGTGLAGALADKDMIDFRYIVDTFASPGLLTKSEISTLARTRQNASAILNAPTVKDFKNSTNPSFRDATTTVFKTSFIKDGGNLALNPTVLYALPGITQGANYAFYYAPGLLVKDNGKNIVVPPAAYVSNNYLDKFTAATPWSIIAGPRRGVVSGPGVVGTEYTFDKADRDILEPFGINPIVFQRGVGLTILGNKTGQQSIKSALSSAHVREVLIYIQNGIADILKDYVFEFNTVQTRLEIKTLVDSFMESVKQDGGVYDFKNIMDSTNNDTEVIDNNMGIVDTYVEPVKGLEIVVHRTTVLNTGEIATGSFL